VRFMAKINEADEKDAQSSMELQKLKNSLSDYDSELASQTNANQDEEICKLKETVEKLKTELILSKEIHKEDSDANKEQICSLIEANEEAMELFENKNKTIEILNDELFKVREELSKLNEHEENFSKEIQEVQEENENLMKENDELKILKKTAMRESELLRMDLKTIQEEALALKEHNGNKFKILELKIKKYEKEISTNAEFYCQKIKHFEENSSEEIQEIQEENEILMKENDELKIVKKTAMRENEELRLDLKSQVELNISTKELIGKMTEIIKTQEVELQNLKMNEKIYDIQGKKDTEEKSESGIDLFEKTFPMISKSLNQINEVFKKSDQMKTKSKEDHS